MKIERVKLKLFASVYPFSFRAILTIATTCRIPFIVRAMEITFLNNSDPFLWSPESGGRVWGKEGRRKSCP